MPSRPQFRWGSLRIPPSIALAWFLTLAAIAADQFFSPILFSSSPLWAALACLLLVWRHGSNAPALSSELARSTFISHRRVLLFVACHLALVSFWAMDKTPSLGGWYAAAAKMIVLLPTLLLFSFSAWRQITRVYMAEGIAAFVVLVTFFPTRIMESLWPWYGTVLGTFISGLSRIFVPTLTYHPALTPTLAGPDLDVTILYACSGIEGLKLFDLLFAFVILLDWNRLLKRRALFAYFVGLAAMLLGNALRISLLVILGNHGFAEWVEQTHLAAGWIFFSFIFLIYLLVVYSWFVPRGAPHESEIDIKYVTAL